MASTSREAPLHAASALAILSGDWLLYAWNVSSELGFRATTTMGALLVGSFVGAVERRSCSAPWAFVKALAAALLVAFPLPVLGALAGGGLLAWPFTRGVARQRRGARS